MSSLNRKDGDYKVKLNGEWVVAKWVTNQDMDSSWSCWRIEGISPPEGSWGFSDKDFEEIDENIVLTNGTEFEIWVQGYAATGESGKAYMAGTGIGNTFDEAVEDYMSKNAEHGITKSRNGRWNIWACNLFDNEADARKVFG